MSCNKELKMNIAFEHLSQIPMIMVMLTEILTHIKEKSVDKRWLSTKEVAQYLSFSTDKISKMLGVEFIENEHYYKKENRNLFDKQKVDEWVLNAPSSNNLSYRDTQTIVNDVLAI